MTAYLHPGVYLEEISDGVKPVDVVATSTAVFVGAVARGPIGAPTLVHSLDEYQTAFGSLSSEADTMGLAANAFYANGGKDAYFVRVADGTSGSSVAAAVDLDGEGASKVLTVLAANEGAWGNQVVIRVRKSSATALTFTLDVGHIEVRNQVSVFVADESFADLTMGVQDPNGAVPTVNASSRLVQLRADDVGAATGAAILPKVVPTGTAVGVSLTGGKAGAPQQADYHAAFAALKKIRDISIILLPGQSMAGNGGGNVAITEALAHCNDVRSRMLILDPPSATELSTAGDVDTLQLSTSNFAVCYYPWVKVPNPFYNVDSNPAANRTLTIAPSAFAAGLWSRTDATRGVWKAPAGVEAQLVGAAGLEFDVEDGEQDQLNPLGINCLRKLPSYGPVVWGARTLATKAEPAWRYVPVRRTALMIEQSVYDGIQWAVFEPNDYRLWSSLRTNIGSFMDNLFRSGAFQGEKASDAYFVRCGLGDTMVQGDIDRGQVIVIVGFAPLKPAEFVIVRIQQKLQQ